MDRSLNDCFLSQLNVSFASDFLFFLNRNLDNNNWQRYTLVWSGCRLLYLNCSLGKLQHYATSSRTLKLPDILQQQVNFGSFHVLCTLQESWLVLIVITVYHKEVWQKVKPVFKWVWHLTFALCSLGGLNTTFLLDPMMAFDTIGQRAFIKITTKTYIMTKQQCFTLHEPFWLWGVCQHHNKWGLWG